VAGNAQSGGRAGASGSSKPNIKKAAFDTTKKKEVGVSDLTLISKVSNEAINDNLKKRFENGEIYVCLEPTASPPMYLALGIRGTKIYLADIYWPCAGFRQSISRS